MMESFGKNLAKTSWTIDPESDEANDLWHSVTLKFDGKKVKKSDIQVILYITGIDGGFIESVYDYQHFNKKQKTYNFEFNDLVAACNG